MKHFGVEGGETRRQRIAFDRRFAQSAFEDAAFFGACRLLGVRELETMLRLRRARI